MVFVLVAAAIVASLVAIEVFRDQIGRWLFGEPVVVYKTQFNANDQLCLKKLVGMQLPADAEVDWAMYDVDHFGESDLAIRIQMSPHDADAFQESITSIARKYANPDASLVLPNPDGTEARLIVETSFAMDDATVDIVVFGKPESEQSPSISRSRLARKRHSDSRHDLLSTEVGTATKD